MDADVIYGQARFLHQSGRLDEAFGLYRLLLETSKNDPALLTAMGMAAYQLGRIDDALGLLEQSLTIDPAQPTAWNIMGLALRQAGRQDRALSCFDRAVELAPNNLGVLSNRAVSLMNMERFDDALTGFERAIALDPNNSDLHYNRGRALHQLGRFAEALASYDRAIALYPGNPALYNNRGLVLYEGLGRYEDALASLNRAVELQPDYAVAHNNRGTVLSAMRLSQQAMASFDAAIRIKPDYPDAHFNLGTELFRLRRFEEALESLHRVLTLVPDHIGAQRMRGNIFMELQRHEEALASYRRVLELSPDMEHAHGDLLHASLHACAWDGLDTLITEILDRLANGQPASMPFEVLAITDSPQAQLQAARLFVAARSPTDDEKPFLKPYLPHPRIRIGYFSADFHGHATMHLIAEMFERHDRARFELIAFSFGPPLQDEWRERAVLAFDRFIDVGSRPDREIAAMARAMEIDIAVDLKGFTAYSRAGIFSHRAAPIQVSYLGYPGTMGAGYMDYLIADRVVVPPEMQDSYAEKIVCLPHSYQVNDTRQRQSSVTFMRQDAGLPETGFVFCSFNNNSKILPMVFDVWMRLLRQVDGSVLWLLAGNPTARRNLVIEATRRGIDPTRLVFAAYAPREEHLARLRLADLFLDSFPYNAHTTASDALRVGLPVLTYSGHAFASRVGASLLTAVGLPELITSSLSDYEGMALELAMAPSRLLNLRDRLRTNLATTPLFDAALYTQNIERAYVAMLERHRRGLAPDHIDLSG